MMYYCLLTSVFAENPTVLTQLRPVDTGINSPAIVTHTKENITLDGVLDEDFWRNSPPITTFYRYIPTDGFEPPGKTEVRFVQNQDALYIGIHVSETDYPIQARISPREDVNDDDQVGIYIDPIGDGRTGYIFYLNPLGIQQDIRYSNGQWMMNWNTIFDTKGVVREDGYSIEMVLPFKSIQYTDAGQWTVSLTRKVPSLGSKYSHPTRVRNHPQLLLQAVPLQNIEPPKQGAGIWLQPTASARQSLNRIPDNAGNESLAWVEKDEGLWATAQPSLDLRWGLTSETALTATVNPDFSQVEGDMRQINLNQRFAFYYTERRPFFLSNVDSFQDNASSLYTRSIVNPIFGAKVAGHEGQWDIGLLTAMDQSPKASVHEFGATDFSSENVEGHSAQSTYLRLRRDAFSAGYIGLFSTDKRILESTQTFKSIGQNTVVGGDFRSNINPTTLLQGYSSASFTGTLQSEFGHRHALSLQKTPDLGWGYSWSGEVSTPSFRQEMGFLTQSGLKTTSLQSNYTSQIGEKSLWRSALQASFKEEFDADGLWSVLLSQEYNRNGLHIFNANIGWREETYAEDTVQGPTGELKWSARINRKLNTVAQYTYNTSLDYSSGNAAQNQQTLLQLLWRPQSNLRMDMDLAQQWYTVATQETISIQRVYNRLNWQFSQYLGTRVILQAVGSSETNALLDSMFTSALLSYIRNPGNEFYLGGTWNFQPNDILLPSPPQTTDLVLNEQLLFAKWTHLFQL